MLHSESIGVVFLRVSVFGRGHDTNAKALDELIAKADCSSSFKSWLSPDQLDRACAFHSVASAAAFAERIDALLTAWKELPDAGHLRGVLHQVVGSDHEPSLAGFQRAPAFRKAFARTPANTIVVTPRAAQDLNEDVAWAAKLKPLNGFNKRDGLFFELVSQPRLDKISETWSGRLARKLLKAYCSKPAAKRKEESAGYWQVYERVDRLPAQILTGLILVCIVTKIGRAHV